MGTFSSFYSHHISTMEGGIVVTDDEELHQILTSLRSHGWTRDLPVKNLICDDKSDDLLEESFRFVLPGYNVRPLELEGILGVEQVKKLPMIISERRKNAKLFVEILSNHPDLLIQKEIGMSSWFGFSIIIRPGSSLTRKELVNKLNHLGFEIRPIVTGNFLKNEVIKFFDYEVHGNLKNAEYLDKHGLFIGNQHYSISDAFEALSTLKI
jgi:CDP-6-deoxy-D-xylo-4-hexulose-3-dehydrase